MWCLGITIDNINRSIGPHALIYKKKPSQIYHCLTVIMRSQSQNDIFYNDVIIIIVFTFIMIVFMFYLKMNQFKFHSIGIGTRLAN